MSDYKQECLDGWHSRYPEKFVSLNETFSHIHRGDRIFIGTACGEPQYLVTELVKYAETHPKTLFDAELMHVWTLGVAPWSDQRFSSNFRHNSFFVGDNTRESVNTGLADYTPIFLSRIPQLFETKRIPIDVALIQTSCPDQNGYVSLGISVDITLSAIENAKIIIAQTNKKMPRVHGDTFINIKDIDFIVPFDEDLLEYSPQVPGDIAYQIGRYVSRIVKDGDTLQLGYGSLPNAILKSLDDKNNLGIHSELLTSSMVEAIKRGNIDNSKKSINKGKTVAAFCMGTRATYEYINDNPEIEFRRISYTNNPMIIAQNFNMVAVNSALQIDLTGQATAESIGSQFFSGIGGHADFMRGANMSPGGRTILVLQSAAKNDQVSRVVPFLDSGAGVTLNRGDINYVITEYGIAYLHGKNIRERAMDLISISHPRFRAQLIEEAKRLNLIYKDQAYIPGKKGEYPEHLEAMRTTVSGLIIKFRPVNINDETQIKDFFYSLSDQSFQRRFMSSRRDMPHKRRQEFVVIDYTREMVILACVEESDKETVVGIGQFIKDEKSYMAEAAFAVSDDYQNKGIGSELLGYLTLLAKREGLIGFTAEVLVENKPMYHVFRKMFPDLSSQIEDGVYDLFMNFGEPHEP
ncbi:MAG: GNAT family N-acetyltransferase [Spirochaetes bacterium]|jgi:acyl-CoA hydrolase/GNAT superfamily N-acetyltransferase|nr:GNAT family N-acetyltransferase [Spirochaetota bacterium]